MISNSLDPPSVFLFYLIFNFFLNFGTNHEEKLLFKYFSQKLTFTDFGKVSQRGYQTLIIKGRIKFTMNSFNLQSFFCTAVGLGDDDDFDATTGANYLSKHVTFCYQWNMGISLWN